MPAHVDTYIDLDGAHNFKSVLSLMDSQWNSLRVVDSSSIGKQQNFVVSLSVLAVCLIICQKRSRVSFLKTGRDKGMDDGLGSFTNALFSEDPGPDSADHPNRDIGGHKVCSMNFMTDQ